MVDDFYEVDDPKEVIVDLVSQEMETMQGHMSELKDQIEQMQQSVEREQKRYAGIATELRTLKDNLDTVPREDIRDKYDEALEVRFRLATMRGQLEKFEASYEYLERNQNLLGQVMSQLQGVEYLPGQEGDGGGQSHGLLDIVGIIRSREEEKERLARQMHDGPAQSLTNFILQAEICQRLFDRNPDRAAEELNNLKTNASKTFQKVREFIFDLRPMMLNDLGVAPTVRRYVESYRDKNDIETSLEIVEEESRLENYREVMIFRSIQELMVMARDYAAPTQVTIKLDMSTNPIQIVVSDDGRGFDASAVFNNDDSSQSDTRAKSLAMIKGQFELVGGSINVQSSDSGGTTVRLELPAE